jgi:heme oxygenase
MESNLPDIMLFKRLRLETRDLHQKMERQLPVFSPDFTLEAYRRLLARYAGFYAPVEEKLTALRADGLLVFDERRPKLALLRLDLERLGGSPNPARCQAVPSLQSVSQGIGCMYVLEGSTLGGQIILRHLNEALGVTEGNGGAFFSSYGPELSRRWKEFREAVALDERAVREADAIVASARATFACFHDWLAADEGAWAA